MIYTDEVERTKQLNFPKGNAERVFKGASERV